MLYATRFFVPDPFIFLEQAGRTTILLGDLEVDRGRREAAVDEVLGLSQFTEEHRQALGRNPTLATVTAHFLRLRGVRRVLVPEDFPLGFSLALERAGVRLKLPANGAFWPARIQKTTEELGNLRRALRITEAGMARGLEVLGAAGIGRGPRAARRRELHWGGAVLTSERLRAEIDSAVLRAGGLPANTIVAGGEQACDPHERGHGPLRAGELLILDIFPRDAATGYFGDLTRTVVKGPATDAQRQLWRTVQEGQQRTLRALRAGADGRALHEATKKFFVQRGYPTEQRAGRHVGFFHGTGHGLGLELHEAPRFAGVRSFQAGTVVTVEPGLYYPGLGGVRIEDVVVVTAEGHERLSRCPQRLEI
jgi:Xaa-Pro aminopeptidase